MQAYAVDVLDPRGQSNIMIHQSQNVIESSNQGTEIIGKIQCK